MSGRLRTFSPQGMPRSRWVAARPLGNLAFAPDWNAPHPYTALVLTTEGPTPQRAQSPSPVPSESGKSTGTLSQSKSGAWTPSPETAEDRLRKIMQICRGCLDNLLTSSKSLRWSRYLAQKPPPVRHPESSAGPPPGHPPLSWVGPQGLGQDGTPIGPPKSRSGPGKGAR